MNRRITRALRGVALAAAVVVVGMADSGAQGSGRAAGFHHVHLNVVDPAASVSFYTKMFDVTKRARVAGWDAIQSENIYLLFNKVPRPAPADLETAMWHFGWGTSNVEADVSARVAKGAVMDHWTTTHAVVRAPDGNLIEFNKPLRRGSEVIDGPHPTAFNHVHLMSAAPLCAADWYEKVLGLRQVSSGLPRPADCRVPFADLGEREAALGGVGWRLVSAPNAVVRIDDIVLFLYPQQRHITKGSTLVSSRGHLLDHFAVSYPDVPAALERLKTMRVRVVEEVHDFGDTKLKAAMIEGPDSVAIELVERRK